jgi:hypothetical protein
MIDAYMHVGEPRFGSAAEALTTCDTWGIQKAVLVLGPGVPDIAALVQAQRARPDRIRTIGIPYGATEEQRLVCAEACWAAGVIGFRLQQDEPLDNPRLMDELGARGGWAYATDPLLGERHTAFYLEWLDRYPRARIGAPHFVSTDLCRLDDERAEALLKHPRFCAIFSRHGQKGSRYPYPHPDLRPWVERVLAWCGWERVLWGSEYPVLYWRGEQIDGARDWLGELGVQMSAEQRAAYLGGNAERLFFQEDSPAVREPATPDWLHNYPRTRPIQIASTGPFELPPDVYAPLLSAYLRRNRPGEALTFAEYLVERLRATLGSARVAASGEQGEG